MNVDKFDTWQYRHNANCWDFVCTWLREKEGIELPRFGIVPDDKRGMTKASINVIHNYLTPIDKPLDSAIAAHYRQRTIIHVGVVDGKFIRHTGKKCGTRKDTIQQFERMSSITRYYLINGNT